MKTTEDVRKYAAEYGISENEALEKGLKEQSAEFVEKALRCTRKRSDVIKIHPNI